MIRGRIARLVTSLGIGSAVAAAGIFFMVASPKVEAQQNSSNTGNVRVDYSVMKINTIIAPKENDKIRQIHLFPDSPIFLVRTRGAITVWERDGSRVLNLREIPLGSDFEELLFLDDNSTFIVQYSRSAEVYSVDRKVTVIPTSPRR